MTMLTTLLLLLLLTCACGHLHTHHSGRGAPHQHTAGAAGRAKNGTAVRIAPMQVHVHRFAGKRVRAMAVPLTAHAI